MRTLELNKIDIWVVEPLGEVDVTDDDGLFTGEKEFTYSTPKKIRLHLYPASGDVLENTFGISAKLDYVTSTSLVLDKKSLLFFSEPIGDYDITYDLKVSKMLKSLSHTTYGLEGRI